MFIDPNEMAELVESKMGPQDPDDAIAEADEHVAAEREIEEIDAERRARVANGVDLWDHLWRSEGEESWRGRALSQVYTRITRLVPHGAEVIDVGGGIGLLARRLRDDSECKCIVLDHSQEAVEQARAAGLEATVSAVGDEVYRREMDDFWVRPTTRALVATEVYEHLPADLRSRVLEDACRIALFGGHVFISVPNDRLGPDEEPQHTCRYTAMDLLREARVAMMKCKAGGDDRITWGEDDARWATARTRVEVLGPYLLLVLSPRPKQHTLSVCTPAFNEGADLEAVLASFRGAADEIVVGVDPRTTDNTREIAKKYAEVVFDLVSPEGPADAPRLSREEADLLKENAVVNDVVKEGAFFSSNLPGWEGDVVHQAGAKRGDFTHVRMPEGGVNFAWIRNQCMNACTFHGPDAWVFMTEAHERLLTGEDVLLRLGELVPKAARVGMVLRTGQGQQWGFPWLSRQAPDIRYARAVHNVLDFPEGTFVVQFPQVRTLHDRVHERTLARAEQRKGQNRSSLFADWTNRKNEASLFYFASEMRELSSEKAIQRMRQFVAVTRNGPWRYHARLILAKELLHLGLAQEAEGKRGLKLKRGSTTNGDFDNFDEEQAPLSEKEKAASLLDSVRNIEESRNVLIQCVGDDWSRNEHWIRLGDLAYMRDDIPEAHRFYQYAALFIEQPPFTQWWIDLGSYGPVPAQRLVMVLGELGQTQEMLFWSKRVLSLLPDNAPGALEEARANIRLIQEAIRNAGRSTGGGT